MNKFRKLFGSLIISGCLIVSSITSVFAAGAIKVGGTITPQWGNADSAGGKASTHRWIANQAFSILANDNSTVRNLYNQTISLPLYMKDESKTNVSNSAESPPFPTDRKTPVVDIVLKYADLADYLENDSYSFQGHFYGADGKNYRGNTTPTAKSRFMEHYNKAIAQYRKNRLPEVYRELGLALHYAVDLDAPHHASNSPATQSGSYHMDFEKMVDDMVFDGSVNNYGQTSATSAGTYNYVKSNSLSQIAESLAVTGRNNFAIANSSKIIGYRNYYFYQTPIYGFDSDKAKEALYGTLGQAQRVSAGILYKLMVDIGKTL